ncbi:MAG: diacylglycerol kinase family lipid kinase [Coriobacteriaceae bacterium]|jgi:YegS/Rv2252/BmrU family lipid kinase|nr:MAG: diacylglycerol kinase family lipid kinase [Coriobacteriaceae bacterium]
MPIRNLGRMLLIANPTAHSGRGAEAAAYVTRLLSNFPAATTSFSSRLTTAPGDGTRLASQSAGFDTVIALGGDGIIHEVANGLMSVEKDARPTLAVVPVGSGNDFARTLGMAMNDPARAMAQLLAGNPRSLDLGHVSSDSGASCHYVQTLSFGLDAAIALDTTDRRADGTRQSGAGLFATSGVKLFSKVRGESSGWPSTVSIDGGEPFRLNTIIFAVQNGPTYGGGFRICPDASPFDGRLDVCYNVGVPALPRLLALFALARTGRHVRSSVVRVSTLERLTVDFGTATPPCQVDGERLVGSRFEVSVVPEALTVIVPGKSH